MAKAVVNQTFFYAHFISNARPTVPGPVQSDLVRVFHPLAEFVKALIYIGPEDQIR